MFTIYGNRKCFECLQKQKITNTNVSFSLVYWLHQRTILRQTNACTTQSLKRVSLLKLPTISFVTANKATIPQFRVFLRKIVENIKIFRSFCTSDADNAKTFSGPLSTVPACACHQLHAVKVLFYAKSVGVVTSGHMTKMAVKPFDLPLPKTPCYTQTTRLYLL